MLPDTRHSYNRFIVPFILIVLTIATVMLVGCSDAPSVCGNQRILKSDPEIRANCAASVRLERAFHAHRGRVTDVRKYDATYDALQKQLAERIQANLNAQAYREMAQAMAVE